MKLKRINNILIPLLVILSFHCVDEINISDEIDQSLLKLVGKYKAVEYTTSSSFDTSVDVLALGGFIEIELFKEKKVTGTLFFPETPEVFGSGYTQNFSGTFEIKKDTLLFKGLNNIISHPQVFFNIRGDTLRTTYGGSPFPPKIIIFVKR